MKERFDAVLAHTYMFKELQADRRLRSSLRGHMQVTALAQMYNEGRIGHIFIAGGKVWGEQYPSLAEVMAKDLESRAIPSEAIVLAPVAKDTPEEIDIFLSHSEKMGWENLASIANRAHLRRIKNIYRRRNIKVETIPTENVLTNIEFRKRFPYRTFLKRFKLSKEELLFNIREGIVLMAYYFGLEKALTKFAQNNRVQKFKVPFDS